MNEELKKGNWSIWWDGSEMQTLLVEKKKSLYIQWPKYDANGFVDFSLLITFSPTYPCSELVFFLHFLHVAILPGCSHMRQVCCIWDKEMDTECF